MNIMTKLSNYRFALEKALSEAFKEGFTKAYKEGFEKGFRGGFIRARIEIAHRLLLRQGRIRFGPLAEEDRRAIQDIDQLEQLSERLLVVSSWAELLAGAGGNAPSSP